MTKYQQRGNLTDCVQWTGHNQAEVEDFIRARMTGFLAEVPELVEFIPTLLQHLVVVFNEDIYRARTIILIQRGSWVVDQGPLPEHPLGVVFTSPERHDYLYREADPR